MRQDNPNLLYSILGCGIINDDETRFHWLRRALKEIIRTSAKLYFKTRSLIATENLKASRSPLAIEGMSDFTTTIERQFLSN